MSNAIFYRCRHCGNVTAVLADAGVTPSCCDKGIVGFPAKSRRCTDSLIGLMTGFSPRPIQFNNREKMPFHFVENLEKLPKQLLLNLEKFLIPM